MGNQKRTGSKTDDLRETRVGVNGSPILEYGGRKVAR